MSQLITLTTDFGTRDAYVAAMKGVILGIHPDVRMVDVSHDVQHADVMEAAFTLRRAYPFFPKGSVHLVVVDPGVGTNRRAIAVYHDGHFFVGPDNGLLLDGGRDVAVAYLESPASVTPAEVGSFDHHMLGDEFEIAGYGVHDANYSVGQLYHGDVTARALKGRWYSLLFDGDYDAYLEWYFTDSPTALPSEEEARDWWKTYRLENKFELLAGGLPGEATGCLGDSGGPLLKRSPHGLKVYGVGFASEASSSEVCKFGSAYLVFNRKIHRFLRDAL